MNGTMADPKEIFLDSLERDTPEELAQFLDEACAGDRKLRARVEELLRAHRQSGSFLHGAEPATDQVLASDRIGSSIGTYRLLEQIGEGGMGVVYKAEQTEPVRRFVALKIIKPGMDSQQVISRFAAERQALALMDHPNIARVLDAGATDTDLPYFVMDLVEGIPITDYCDQQRLSTRQRLALFAAVSQAVQHAHQKGVIHRDIKPSNVLVADYDGKAVPKIIDFGVAKATGPQIAAGRTATRFGQIVGTFEYMSPEQAGFNDPDVDTRSDIYSLGVLLYELLVGSTPFDKDRLQNSAIEQALRIIRDEEPQRPSARLSTLDASLATTVAARHDTQPNRLVQLVRGELDWIVMKCLEKDRSRRYETASALAQDVERYLADEPVQACPPSTLYRLGKFARRNWAAIGAGLTLLTGLLLLVSGLAISNRMIAASRNETANALLQRELALEEAKESADEAEQQRQRAVESSRKALTAVRDLLIFPTISHDDWSQIPASLRRKFRDEAAAFYASLPQGGTTDPTLRYETAIGQRALGFLYQQSDGPEEAELFLRQSVGILEELHRESPDNADYELQLARSLYLLHRTLWWLRRLDEAEVSAARSIDLYEELMSKNADVSGSAAEIYEAYLSRGTLLATDLQRIDDAERMYSRAIEFHEQHAARVPTEQFRPSERVRAYDSLAGLQLRIGKSKAAADTYDSGLKVDSDDALRWYRAAALYLSLGEVERYRNACREMLDRADKLAAKHPNVYEWTAKTCALSPDSVPDFSRVERLAQRGVTGTENHPWRRNFVLTKALTDYRSGHFEEAVGWFEQFAPNAGGEHFDATAFAGLALAHHQLGRREQSQESLAAARNIIANKPLDAMSGAFWFDWLHSEILFREAEALME